MKKPVILIFASRNEDTTFCGIRYSDAIMASGGIPLIVPMKTGEDELEQLCEVADGFLFAGGVDIDPKYFGEEKLNDTVVIDEIRDTLEIAAMKYVERSGKPVIGICRGIQSVNVGLGGSLWQDIPAQIEGALCHMQKVPGSETTHEVTVKPGTRLYGITGAEKIMTNSFHHQSVKTPGRNLTVSAVTSDGIIEALESSDDRFIMLFQWHPEFTATTDRISAGIFDAFVKECEKIKNN